MGSVQGYGEASYREKRLTIAERVTVEKMDVLKINDDDVHRGLSP